MSDYNWLINPVCIYFYPSNESVLPCDRCVFRNEVQDLQADTRMGTDHVSGTGIVLGLPLNRDHSF